MVSGLKKRGEIETSSYSKETLKEKIETLNKNVALCKEYKQGMINYVKRITGQYEKGIFSYAEYEYSLNRGFKPSIRRKRYRLQPNDLVKYDGNVQMVKGIHCYGRRVVLGSGESVNVKKIMLIYYGKGLQFMSGKKKEVKWQFLPHPFGWGPLAKLR